MKYRPVEWHIAAIKAKTKPVGDCWIWQGFIAKNGYGEKQYRGKTVRVHRLMYELTNGPIPKGLHVCHSCDTRACCNPAHLWLGDDKANALDVVHKGRHYASLKTHCPRGHSYAENAHYTPIGNRRNCKICERARNRIRAGWPEDLAYSAPAVPKGKKPVNARYTAVRKVGPRAKKFCKRGHEFSGDNVYVAPNGNRQCAICRRYYRTQHEKHITAVKSTEQP